MQTGQPHADFLVIRYFVKLYEVIKPIKLPGLQTGRVVSDRHGPIVSALLRVCQNGVMLA